MSEKFNLMMSATNLDPLELLKADLTVLALGGIILALLPEELTTVAIAGALVDISNLFSGLANIAQILSFAGNFFADTASQLSELSKKFDQQASYLVNVPTLVDFTAISDQLATDLRNWKRNCPCSIGTPSGGTPRHSPSVQQPSTWRRGHLVRVENFTGSLATVHSQTVSGVRETVVQIG